MPSKLEQVTALVNGQRSVQSFQLDDLPELEGPGREQIQKFNAQLKEWKRKTEVRLSEQMTVPTQQSSA